MDSSKKSRSDLKRGRKSATELAGDQRLAALAKILDHNPILDAYLLNYLANFYVGPLLKLVDSRQGLTRPEWIVVFCLTQHPSMTAQQISDVTGRAKSSISHAVKLLQKKQFLVRTPDSCDGRRHVLKLTASGSAAYSDLIGFFTMREEQMVGCLTKSERRVLRRLLIKLAAGMAHWAKSY